MNFKKNIFLILPNTGKSSSKNFLPTDFKYMMGDFFDTINHVT